MITVASHECRTILGRLDKGVDLIDGLLEVCRQRQVRTGTVVALGALQAVDVAHYDTAHKQYRPGRRLEGPLEILSAVGNLSERKGELALHLHITLSREGDNGIEVLGGHVLSGEVYACEFSITALDDVMLRRAMDSETGLPLWKEGFERDDAATTATPLEDMGRVGSGSSDAAEAVGEPDSPVASAPKSKSKSKSKPEPKPKSKPKLKQPPTAVAKPAKAKPSKVEPSWADVAAASEQAQVAGGMEPPLKAPPAAPLEREEEDEVEGEDELDYVEVEPGDYVDHPRFKRCTVARVEGDMEYVQVRLRNGNIVRLSLDIVTLTLVGSEGGHQVFQAIIDT